jgi:ADP-glucose pyrophosphorylase
VTLPGTPAPVRRWADPAEVEQSALRQVRTIAGLPWVHGVAVMPVVHYGEGATVGSVIAMKDAVIRAQTDLVEVVAHLEPGRLRQGVRADTARAARSSCSGVTK